MGRNLEFDHNQVLNRAMQVFREKGYEKTSIKELEKATGLSSGSLYNSFGGKQALFAAVMQHYNTTVVQQRIKHYLEEAFDPLQGIKNLFHSLLNEPGKTSYGCLLTNTAVEFNNHSTVVTQDLDTGFKLLESGFRNQLRKCHGMGLVSTETCPEQTALQLLVFYQGILVFVRSGLRHREVTLLINKTLNQILGGKAL
ncbi:TetR/AcrR family transcriptional regulator [Kiloniella laminariae]|uniref:TetR/AcrR family transcriptional regulator n=1 Tax=Kiloniella laminariae TaxID=454162 RepID=UPI000A06E608|nr:TetR/AcrR family transcriptional regulator [Kiloniella laminariae]